jgi:thiamine-phosphate pyrophosphorylase
MFVFKKKYFFIIENTKDIDLKKIKNFNKFNIVYRFKELKEKISNLIRYRKLCKSKKIGFFVSNDVNLMTYLKADGLYVSAYNKSHKIAFLKKSKYKIIGSAHNLKEFNIKKKQGCDFVFLSRLFKTNYKNKDDFLGIIKFNLFSKLIREKLVPLGGINTIKLNSIQNDNCEAIALSSQIKLNNYINKKFY